MYRIPVLLFLFISINASAFSKIAFQEPLLSTANDSISIQIDSTNIADSLSTKTDSLTATKEKADSILIFTGSPFSEASIILSYKDLIKTDYRYTGDFFKLSGFSFNRDLGFIGQNNEMMIYGIGFNGISYSEDGVLVNNRSLNQFDLNNIPSESIDSIEILPAVRGFLYSALNNPVGVNFISKDRVPGLAYSRIKYYEGPFGEGMIDGIVSTNILRRLVLYFEASNKKVERRYLNSSSSSWLGRIKLKYFWNNYLNLQASYGYVKSTKGLNGGVDIASIINSGSEINSVMYNEVLAPVYFAERSYDVKQHHFGLRALSELNNFSKTDLNFYYKFSLEELNNTENPESLAKDLKDKTLGTSLRQVFSKGIFSAEINGVCEYTDYLAKEFFQIDTNAMGSTYLSYNSKKYSVAGIISAHTKNNKFKFSAFCKLSGTEYDFLSDLNNLIGYGFDMVWEPYEKISLYAGYSYFEPQQNAESISTFEGSIKYSDENIVTGLQIFLRKSEVNTTPVLFRQMSDILNPYQDMIGIELNLKTKFWKILFEGRGALYSESADSFTLYNIPKQNFNAGVYFTDTLFNSNLDLKAGFVYYFIGEQNLFNYKVPNSSRVDFTLAGEIQKAAIAYFTWENLLGYEYFIVPYYPMSLRGIRFGVSWEFLN